MIKQIKNTNKILVILVGVLIFLAIIALKNITAPEANSNKDVVFLRSVYEDSGRWYLVADVTEAKNCLDNECPNLETNYLSADLVTYVLPRRFNYSEFEGQNKKNSRLTPSRLKNILDTRPELQSTPFVMTSSDNIVLGVEEVFDPSF
ncbi:MAG: hypothetical protein QG665_501 [Patescibacteria group bacterium]|nr:hypothetical protein [Patescibacteria group bacterium]